nr:unnamed protein product [Digitaria exilis]
MEVYGHTAREIMPRDTGKPLTLRHRAVHDAKNKPRKTSRALTRVHHESRPRLCTAPCYDPDQRAASQAGADTRIMTENQRKLSSQPRCPCPARKNRPAPTWGEVRLAACHHPFVRKTLDQSRFQLPGDSQRHKKGKDQQPDTYTKVLLAIFLPPVGVFLRYGCGVEFWIDLLLTILGYIPGIIYALYVLTQNVWPCTYVPRGCPEGIRDGESGTHPPWQTSATAYASRERQHPSGLVWSRRRHDDVVERSWAGSICDFRDVPRRKTISISSRMHDAIFMGKPQFPESLMCRLASSSEARGEEEPISRRPTSRKQLAFRPPAVSTAASMVSGRMRCGGEGILGVDACCLHNFVARQDKRGGSEARNAAKPARAVVFHTGMVEAGFGVVLCRTRTRTVHHSICAWCRTCHGLATRTYLLRSDDPVAVIARNFGWLVLRLRRPLGNGPSDLGVTSSPDKREKNENSHSRTGKTARATACSNRKSLRHLTWNPRAIPSSISIGSADGATRLLSILLRSLQSRSHARMLIYERSSYEFSSKSSQWSYNQAMYGVTPIGPGREYKAMMLIQSTGTHGSTYDHQLLRCAMTHEFRSGILSLYLSSFGSIFSPLAPAHLPARSCPYRARLLDRCYYQTYYRDVIPMDHGAVQRCNAGAGMWTRVTVVHVAATQLGAVGGRRPAADGEAGDVEGDSPCAPRSRPDHLRRGDGRTAGFPRSIPAHTPRAVTLCCTGNGKHATRRTLLRAGVEPLMSGPPHQTRLVMDGLLFVYGAGQAWLTNDHGGLAILGG